MLSIMHKADEQGYFTIAGRKVETKTLAGLVNSTDREVTKCIEELRRNNVFSITEDGIIFSRRMVRDRIARDAAKEFGRQGGNPDLAAKRKRIGEGGVNPPPNHPVNGVVNEPHKLQEARSKKLEARSEREGSAQERAAPARPEKIPEDWLPDTELVVCAKEAGITDLVETVEQFVDYYTANGKPMADWNAAFRVWCRREPELRRNGK